MDLYTYYRSTSSYRVRIALALKGLDYQALPVNLIAPSGGEHRQAAYLAINPQGQIPAMTEGDLVLTESLGIVLYLARAYGGALGPANDAETALMEQWALFASTAIEGPALDIAMTITKGQDKSPEGAALVAKAVEVLRRPLARLEAHLVGQEWLVGGRFTVADIMAEECTRYAQPHPTLLAEYPAISAWIARCQARPAFQKMWAGRLAEPA